MIALVVDDSRAMRAILNRALAELGFDVVEAEDGAQALELLEKLRNEMSHVPELVVVDWHMPNMNGIELTRELRRDDRFESSRILIVTIESEIQRVEEALTIGCDEYLMKPFSAAALSEKLSLLGLEVRR